jgi:hypothetical protein
MRECHPEMLKNRVFDNSHLAHILPTHKLILFSYIGYLAMILKNCYIPKT